MSEDEKTENNINEFYKLKENYEKSIEKMKKKILNSGLSKKDKQKDIVREQEDVLKTLIQSANDGGQETVTTMVNYVAPTTWWNPAKEKDAGLESGESSVVPQPEDA